MHRAPVGLGTVAPLRVGPVCIHARPYSSRRLGVAIQASRDFVPRPAQTPKRVRGDAQVVAGATDYPLQSGMQQPQPMYDPTSFGGPDSAGRLGEAARQSLAKATSAMRRYGWIAFWIQLALSVVSAVILLFSVAFTSQSGPKASLYLTLVGILAGFLSTFWNLGYQRTSARMQEYLDGLNVAKVKKQAVVDLITRGIMINIVGMGSTLIGISTLVGLLVAKTLSNASVNPFMASAAGGYNPVLALDVFLVQAATNTLLGHFLSLLCSLWLLNIVGEGRGLRFQRQQHMQRVKDADGPGGSLISGTVKGFAGVYNIPQVLKKRSGGGGGGGGGGSWPTRTAATAATAGSQLQRAAPRGLAGGGLGSQGFGGGVAMGFSSSSRGVPVVAATAAAEADADPLMPSPTAAALMGSSGSYISTSTSNSGWPSLPGGSSNSIDATISSSSSSSMEVWKAAARPAAAAAARTAAALESEGLPVPAARPPKLPEQRLAQDFLLMPTRTSLAYLDGSLPGDAGFDPLGLFEPQGSAALLDRRWLVTSEVIHGRWAMLGAVGCLFPELLGKPAWFKTGWLPLADAAATSGGSGISSDVAEAVNGSGMLSQYPFALGMLMLAGMGVVEWFRLCDYRQPGSMGEPLQVLLPRSSPELSGGFAGSGVAAYPGGPVFNCLSYVESGPALSQFKDAEMRHGRLAMLGMLGFATQALVTGVGPLQNLQEHVQAPLQHNILSSIGQELPYVAEVPGSVEGSRLSAGVAAVHWWWQLPLEQTWQTATAAAEAAAAAAAEQAAAIV